MADQDPNPTDLPVDPPVPDPVPVPDPAPDPAPDPTPSPAPAAKDWRDARIAQLTAQIGKLKNAPPAAVTPPVPAAAPVIDDAEIDRRAAERAAISEFNRQCTDCQQSGRSQFTDFDTRVNNLRQLVDINNTDEVRRWNQFLSAAFETGNAPQLLQELGNDLNEAQRLLTLPPMQMAVALARRTPVNTNNADPPPLPNPLRPVNDRGASHARIEPDDPERGDRLDVATWMARRQAQVKERGIR